jgi:cell division protein FtsW
MSRPPRRPFEPPAGGTHGDQSSYPPERSAHYGPSGRPNTKVSAYGSGLDPSGKMNPLFNPKLLNGDNPSGQGFPYLRVAPDGILIYTTLILFLIGLLAVYSASSFMGQQESQFSFAYVLKQAMAGVLGIIAMISLMRVPFWRWQRLAMPFALTCVVLLVITRLFGSTANGSERWIALPLGFTLQPSEFAKIAAVMLLAQVTSLTGNFWLKPKFFANMAVLGLMIGLIFIQPNLSISLMISTITLVMLFTAGLPLGVFITIGIPTLYVLYNKVRHTPYQWARIVGWLNPEADPQGKGYNLLHSYYAIASGGVQGVGYSRSIQKLFYLPFRHTDFIFSVWCEEFGFIGGICLIALFALMASRGFLIAHNCPNRFGERLAFGLTLALVLQASMNMAVTLGLMPVTGVTLPLISYGGTSVLVTFAIVGILLNISRYRANHSVS